MRSSLARSSSSLSFAFGGIAHMLRFTTEYEGRMMSVAAAVKRGCAAQGWRFLEVVGRFATDALPGTYLTYFSSPTSRKNRASARTKGVTIKKLYVQRETPFLTVTKSAILRAGVSRTER